MAHEASDEEFIVQRLRAAAPDLPAGLRARVLAGTTAAPAPRPRRTRRWAMAVAVCLAAQWLVTAVLNGQREALLASRPAPGTRLAISPPHRVPAGVVAHSVRSGIVPVTVGRSAQTVTE
jgi:hypothetical protein